MRAPLAYEMSGRNTTARYVRKPTISACGYAETYCIEDVGCVITVIYSVIEDVTITTFLFD